MAKDYFGTFKRVDVIDAEESRNTNTRETVVGSRVNLVFDKDEDDRPTVNVRSLNDYSLGSFDHDFSEKLNYLRSSGREIAAVISCVGYTQENGNYWTELAIFAYPESEHDTWDRFIDGCSEMFADGKRPDPNLTPKAISAVRSTKGEWCSPKEALLPKLPKGEVYVKINKSTSDKLIGKAQSGNKGCLVVSWVLFILIVIAIILTVWRYLIR